MNCTRKGSGQTHDFSKGNSVVGYGRTPKTISFESSYSTAMPTKEVMNARDLILNIYINKMRQDQLLAQNQKPTVPSFFDYVINHPLPEEAVQIMLTKKAEESFSLVTVLENLPIPKGKEKEFLDNLASKMPNQLLSVYKADYKAFVDRFKPVPLKKGYEYREDKLR
jgi:hypothetical protein